MRASSKWLLSNERHGTSTTSQGSLLHCLTTLKVKKFFLKSNVIWCTCVPHLWILPSVRREKQPAPLSTSLLQGVAGSHEAVSQPLLLQTRQPKCSQPLLIRHVFQHLNQLCYPPMDAFKYINILFILWRPELHTIFKVRLTSFDWLTMLCLMHPKMQFTPYH